MSTTIGQRIKEIRIKKGYTQQKLAELVGYKDKASISIIEKNGDDLTQSKIVAFAKALGVTPRDLLGEQKNVFEATLDAEHAMLIYAYDFSPEIIKDCVWRVLNYGRPKGGDNHAEEAK